jgi:hypothetical protein
VVIAGSPTRSAKAAVLSIKRSTEPPHSPADADTLNEPQNRQYDVSSDTDVFIAGALGFHQGSENHLHTELKLPLAVSRR